MMTKSNPWIFMNLEELRTEYLISDRFTDYQRINELRLWFDKTESEAEDIVFNNPTKTNKTLSGFINHVRSRTEYSELRDTWDLILVGKKKQYLFKKIEK